MTSENTPVSESTTCAFPGCARPVRPKAGDGRGKPTGYCDLINPATGKPAHTSLSAAREREKRERLKSDAVAGETATVEAPASASLDRSQGLLDQFRHEISQMAGTLQAATEALAVASDPATVHKELAAARLQVQRSRLEAAEQIQAVERARDQALADAETARTEAGEATTARDEAIAELETVEAALTALRQELEQVRAGHVDELAGLTATHAAELRQVRADAEQQVTAAHDEAAEQVRAAEHRAAEQARAAQAEATRHVQAAEQARDQALAEAETARTEASAARQAATDASRRADEAREELRQARAEHRAELAELRQDHRVELAAERDRADAALDAARSEHRREIDALRQALAALGAQHEQTRDERTAEATAGDLGSSQAGQGEGRERKRRQPRSPSA